MAVSQEEVDARLAAISNGPWARRLPQVRLAVGPIDRLKFPLRGKQLIALDEFELSPSNRRKSGRLSRLLRPHFIEGATIDSRREMDTRDAFDNALTIPQLYELAVQTGYLPMESVRTPARSILTELLWSEPARRFVVAYDYLSVPMLAARVGVSGITMLNPPDPNPNASLHFAAFLAHLRTFHTDQHIRLWIGFLDDYVIADDEQEQLWKYLRGQQQTPPPRTDALLRGCHMFVASLAGAFHVMGEEELGLFGLIHAYWLQKFFGYKRDVYGQFVKDIERWGRNDSWARTISTSARLVPPGSDADIEAVIRRQFADRVALLEKTFAAVRDIAAQSRQTPTYHEIVRLPVRFGRDTTRIRPTTAL